MRPESLRDTVTFRKTSDERRTWTDVISVRAYINGVSGNEFYMANAGSEAALVVTITCRYQPALMTIDPTKFRAVDQRGWIYELISPADDKQSRHREAIFRARRIYSDEE
jgi:head-tail adaptor